MPNRKYTYVVNEHRSEAFVRDLREIAAQIAETSSEYLTTGRRLLLIIRSRANSTAEPLAIRAATGRH